MWIITHDNVHEAACNPAMGMIKSKDYITRRTRQKGDARRHEFKLLSGGVTLFYGVAYFDENQLNKDTPRALEKELLRPLDEFGASLYDCDDIQYMSTHGWVSITRTTD